MVWCLWYVWGMNDAPSLVLVIWKEYGKKEFVDDTVGMVGFVVYLFVCAVASVGMCAGPTSWVSDQD